MVAERSSIVLELGVELLIAGLLDQSDLLTAQEFRSKCLLQEEEAQSLDKTTGYRCSPESPPPGRVLCDKAASDWPCSASASNLKPSIYRLLYTYR